MIQQVGDRFVISAQQVWRPGSYESQEAARYAQRLPDEVLQQLQDSVRPGTITLGILKQAAKELL